MSAELKTNYHTHTTFCDGKDSAENMVLCAIQKGFSILGFSGHSMYPFSSDWHIQSRSHAEYCNEIRRLKACYEGAINIALGFEADFIEGVCAPQKERYAAFAPDYLIGAVHYVPCGSAGWFEADGSFETTRKNIQALFGGNVQKAVGAYFSCERAMLKKGGFEILAHCDLIRKQNSPKAGIPLFSENDEWYKSEIRALADDIARAGVIAEINTGGMARGYLNTPYPSLELLTLLCERGVPVTINSDAHSAENLDYGFDFAKNYALKAGYKEIAFLEKGSMRFKSL